MTRSPAVRLDIISRTVHEALRAWAAGHDQDDIPAWGEAPEWMREATRESVHHVLGSAAADGRSQHAQWLVQKQRDGWQYGAVKDAAARTHPMMVDYDDLPDWEKRKDDLINAIVRSLV